MIKNLYQLGKALQTSEEYSRYFSPWQNPFPNVDPDKAKVLYFDIREDGMPGSLHIEPFKPNLLKQYLYRKPKGARGAPLVPTDYFYPSKKEKDHEESIRKLLSRLDRAFSLKPHLYFDSEEEKKAALSNIEIQLLNFEGNYDDRYLITFKVKGQWLGEIQENIDLFEAEAYSKYYEKSSAKEQVCSITYEKKPEVWGRVDTLGFTVNDLTFSRNGFSPEDSYKMFPASPEAVKTLEGARRFALAELTRNFYSLQYFIVPHFIQESDELTLRAVKRIVKEASQKETLTDLSQTIFNNEKIIAHLAERNDLAKSGIFYDILFFQKNQAQFAIKLHLTDILPSRFARIFGVKGQIETRYGRINRITTKDGVIDFFVTFARIQRFFSTKVKKEVIFHPFFFKVLESVFYGQKLNEQSVITAMVGQIQLDYKQRHESAFKYIQTTKEAFAIWHFFLDLGLFDYQNIHQMESKPVQRTLDGFIEDHPDFFEKPYKKAAFLMGCLTEILLYAQRNKLHSEPFLEKLNGLSFDDRDLQKLFPQLLDKINQYGDTIYEYASTRNYVQRLRSEIVPILMENSDLNRAEISFAFTAGLVMQKEFTAYEIEKNKAKKANKAVTDAE